MVWEENLEVTVMKRAKAAETWLQWRGCQTEGVGLLNSDSYCESTC